MKKLFTLFVSTLLCANIFSAQAFDSRGSGTLAPAGKAYSPVMPQPARALPAVLPSDKLVRTEATKASKPLAPRPAQRPTVMAKAIVPAITERIYFTEEILNTDFGTSRTFSSGDFSLTVINELGTKAKVITSYASFGDTSDYISFNYRLQTGGASKTAEGERLGMQLLLPSDGQVTVYARSGNTSAARALQAVQNGDTLFANTFSDTDRVSGMYPVYSFSAQAGTVDLLFNDGSMYIYGFDFTPPDKYAYNVRIRKGDACTMPISNGLWLWWWSTTDPGACVPTTYEDGWYSATILSTNTTIGCLAVNTEIIDPDSWAGASQTVNSPDITDDVCLEMGAPDAYYIYDLYAVSCTDEPTPEPISPSFDFTNIKVQNYDVVGFTNNYDIHIRTSGYSESYNDSGFESINGTELYLYAFAKSMTSLVGTFTVNGQQSIGDVYSAQLRYGNGSNFDIIDLNSGYVTITLDENGNYLLSYELTDTNGNTYTQSGLTFPADSVVAYEMKGGNTYPLTNEQVSAALSASEILAMTSNLSHTDITTMSYFAEGIVDYMLNDSAQMVQYGTGRFYISDDGTRNNEYYLYNTKWLGNTSFTAENAGLLHLGDTLVAFGPVQNYKGTVPEMQKGYVYEYRPYVEEVTFSAPENLTATTLNGYDYTFSWSGGNTPAPTYQLDVFYEGNTYHSSSLSGTSKEVTLAIEGAYAWQVSALDAAENIVATTEATDSVTAYNVPDYSITNLQITVSDSTMTATWESIANYFGIYIYDANNNQIVWKLIGNKSYTWSGAVGTYTFYVGPVNDELTYWIGDWANQQFTFYAEDPAEYAPYNLQAQATYGRINLNWDADTGSYWTVKVIYNGDSVYFNANEKTLVLNVSGLENTTFDWAVATTDANHNLLSQYVYGPSFVMPKNPYQLLNLQASTEDGYTYTFTWEYDSLPAPQYLIYISDANHNTIVEETVLTTSFTHTFTQSGIYHWTIYALDEEGLGLGYHVGADIEVVVPNVHYFTITTTVPADCEMDFSKGMWYYWWNNEDNKIGSVRALLNEEGKYVATIEAPCEYIGCVVATADPLTTSWDSLQQTHDSPTLYGDTCLYIGIHDWGKYWYLDARPCHEDLSNYLPENLKVTIGVGTAHFTWTATEYEYFEILTNHLETPDKTSRYIQEVPNLSLMFNPNGVGKWQWRVRALSQRGAPLSEFVEGPEFEIKENPYLPYNLKATTQDSTTYYLTWEADVEAPQYYVQVGNGFEEYVTTQPVEVHFEQEGYYYWRVIPCDSTGKWLGFVYGEDIYVPAKATPDYSISDLQVITNGNTTTATWNSTWDYFAVWLYDQSTWNRIGDFTTMSTFAQWNGLAAGNYQVNVIALDAKGDYVWDTETIVSFTIEETPAPMPQYSIYLAAGEGGSVNTDINGKYDAGTLLALVATPNSGYQFAGWSDGNLQAERILVLTQDTTLLATFEMLPPVRNYTLTVNSAVGGSTNLTGEQTYEEGAAVTLIAYPETGYTFTKWVLSDSTETTDNPLFLTMNADLTVTPVFTEKAPEETYTLTVNTIGQGTVSISPKRASYKRGDLVALKATPSDGWEFVQWSDGDKGLIHQIVITQDTVMTAIFKEQQATPVYYTLTTEVVGEGSITRHPEQSQYEEYATVTLTAVPADGWIFKHWENGSTTVTRDVLLTSDTTVTATFEKAAPDPVYYTLTVSTTGQGKVSVSPEQEQYLANTVVTLTAEPEEGWLFKQWGDGEKASTRQLTMDEDKSLKAIFVEASEYAVKDLAVSVTKQTAKATWSSDAEYFEVRISNKRGVEQVCDTVSVTTFTFKGDQGQTYTIAVRPMESDRATYLAEATSKDFTLEQLYNVFISANSGGTVNDEEVNGDYEFGTQITIIATPKEGYRFKKWSDGDTVATRTITIEDDIYLEASFTRIPTYMVTVYESVNGTTDFVGDTTLLEGSTFRVTAIPNEGYRFSQWLVNGEVVTENPFALTAIDQNYSIEAFFEEEETGLNEIMTTEGAAEKFYYEGRLYIRRGEHVYDAQGKQVQL